MWQRLAQFVLKYRRILLIVLLLLTGVMGYFASKVKLSYEFSKAIPTDNPKYLDYQAFRKTFGDDGNLLVIGVQTKDLFRFENYRAYKTFEDSLKNISGVESILSIPSSVILMKDSTTEKLQAVKIFGDINNQLQLDSALQTFYNLPFYKTLLYNPDSYAYLMGARINKNILASSARTQTIEGIQKAAAKFEKQTQIETHLSGLPLIRTVVADRIRNEMKYFLLGSLLFSVVILMLFFRSVGTTLLSLAIVLVGVIWTVALIYLCGYNITLLTALLPSLVVVIGIPNCIYFINKYHSSYVEKKDKTASLIEMVSKMGIVTLFCNIAAAIGFAVFAFTRSAILKEFGVVAGLSIMIIFCLSFILLPSVLSYLKAPEPKELRYLENKWISAFLLRIEKWVFHHQKMVLGITFMVLVISGFGIARLKTVGYIVDDLPKTDKVFTDLKFFEKNFHGVMPLEIVIDTKKRNGLTGMRALSVFEKVDSLSSFIAAMPEMNRPLSVAEGLKFAKQGFYENDSLQYIMPNSFDGAFVGDYLKPSKNEKTGTGFSNMIRSFIDSNKSSTRISISMADVGTEQLPVILNKVQQRANQIFDSSYSVTLTGTSITFLEGSKFIINGLKESVAWAFLLIALCMLYLFSSFRILICSLLPNVIPLTITAGIMGWAGVPLKPSTVLVFSVALGIAVDITIRFLVNYKQELPHFNNNISDTVSSTIRHTGLSIIYTSLVLTAGFIIFCFSGFGGTQALGWLTSVTLLAATLTNIILLPVLILLLAKQRKLPV